MIAANDQACACGADNALPRCLVLIGPDGMDPVAARLLCDACNERALECCEIAAPAFDAYLAVMPRHEAASTTAHLINLLMGDA